MKFFAVVILVALQGLTLAQGQTIQDTIEELVERIKNVIPEPLVIPDVDFVAPENDYVYAYANATNNKLSGLRDFGVKIDYRGVIIPIPTGFTITIRNLNFFSDLLTALQLEFASPIYSNEILFNTLTTDLVFKGGLNFNLIPLNFSVTHLESNVGGIEFNIQGVVSDRFSERLSQFLTDHVANVLNRLLESISPLIVNAINDIISGIFDEMKVNSNSVSTEGSEERAAQELKEFFEILIKNLELNSS